MTFVFYLISFAPRRLFSGVEVTVDIAALHERKQPITGPHFELLLFHWWLTFLNRPITEAVFLYPVMPYKRDYDAYAGVIHPGILMGG